MSQIKVACLQYQIRPLASLAEFQDQVSAQARTAADYGSRLILFPEYFSLQLLSLLPTGTPAAESLRQLGRWYEDFLTLFRGLARETGSYIIAGTFPRYHEASCKLLNESYIFSPEGETGCQPKLQMTRFEREDWQVQSGQGLQIFDTALGRLAICVCYDIEFPEIARQAASQGAMILAVPSCTDTRYGYMRVRLCAQARAVENQLYVLHSPTVGGLPGIPSAALNYGRAAIYCPSDSGFPRDGLVEEGTLNQEDIVMGTLDLEALRKTREDGSVLLFKDAPRTQGLLENSQVVRL